jgi:hypothetical protein
VLELIGRIVLVYYLVLGVVLLVFLGLGLLADRRLVKRRRYETGTGCYRLAPYDREPEHATTRRAAPAGRPPDNVVRFNYRK